MAQNFLVCYLAKFCFALRMSSRKATSASWSIIEASVQDKTSNSTNLYFSHGKTAPALRSLTYDSIQKVPSYLFY